MPVNLLYNLVFYVCKAIKKYSFESNEKFFCLIFPHNNVILMATIFLWTSILLRSERYLDFAFALILQI